MSEPLIGLLAGLPSAELDPARSERIRTRCRDRLARTPPSDSTARAPFSKSMQIWQPLVAMLGAAYLTVVLIQAVRLYAIL